MIMENNKNYKELLETINLKKLQGVLFQSIASMLSGTQLNTETVNIQLSVPKGIYDLINEVSKPFDISPKNVFTQMASDGLMNSLQNILSMGDSVKEEIKETKDSPVEDAIPGLKGITEKLGGLKDLTEQLQGMQRLFENVQQNTNPDVTETKKNHE